MVCCWPPSHGPRGAFVGLLVLAGIVTVGAGGVASQEGRLRASRLAVAGQTAAATARNETRLLRLAELTTESNELRSRIDLIRSNLSLVRSRLRDLQLTVSGVSENISFAWAELSSTRSRAQHNFLGGAAVKDDIHRLEGELKGPTYDHNHNWAVLNNVSQRINGFTPDSAEVRSDTLNRLNVSSATMQALMSSESNASVTALEQNVVAYENSVQSTVANTVQAHIQGLIDERVLAIRNLTNVTASYFPIFPKKENASNASVNCTDKPGYEPIYPGTWC